MHKNSSIISTQQLNEFFHQRLNDESKLASPPFSDPTLSYLVNLLVHYNKSRNFFVQSETGIEMPTLAFLYRDAVESTSATTKLLTLHRLGDSALLIGAIFPEKLARFGINKDYYIGMGSGAYSTLAEQHYGDPDVFNELANRFPKLLRLLATVFSRQLDFDADEIFSLYKRWQLTGDEMLRQQLTSLGITTVNKSNKFH